MADGAMATMLAGTRPAANRCWAALNLQAPQRVLEVHRGYLRAGARVLGTNTFGAHRPALRRYGPEAEVPQINAAGVRLARTAAEKEGAPAFVAGCVGPVLPYLDALGRAPAPAETRAALAEQVEALLAEGVDLLSLETFGDAEELAQVVELAQEWCDLPVVAQTVFLPGRLGDPGPRTPGGQTPEQVVAILGHQRPTLLGVNCTEPALALQALASLAPLWQGWLVAQPNAGLPALACGRQSYPQTPHTFATHAPDLLNLGVRLLGGCCGTTPAHIRALGKALKKATFPSFSSGISGKA